MIVLSYFYKLNLPNKMKNAVSVTVTDPYGQKIITLEGEAKAGINRIVWDMRLIPTKEEIAEHESRGRGGPVQGKLVPPGEFVMILKIGDKKLTQNAQIRPMPSCGN